MRKRTLGCFYHSEGSGSYAVFIIRKEAVMSEKIILFGYGAVGQAVAQQLSDAGRAVTVVQRSRPAALPPLAT